MVKEQELPPAARGIPTAIETIEPPETRRKLSGLVIIVDDDKHILPSLVLHFLAAFPTYDQSKIFTYSDTLRALTDLKNGKFRGQVDLVITDEKMIISGEAIATAAKTVNKGSDRPAPAILATTAGEIPDWVFEEHAYFFPKLDSTRPGYWFHDYLRENFSVESVEDPFANK